MGLLYIACGGDISCRGMDLCRSYVVKAMRFRIWDSVGCDQGFKAKTKHVHHHVRGQTQVDLRVASGARTRDLSIDRGRNQGFGEVR